MTHRLYSSPDRARHQLDRHADETPPLSDGSGYPPAWPQIVISEEAREAMGVRLAEFGKSLRAGFQPRPQSSE